MKFQTLENSFYDLKAEVLKRMKNQSYLYFYQDLNGDGFTLHSRDMLAHRYGMSGFMEDAFDVDNVVRAYQTHIKKYLSRDECLQMAITRFKEILAEMDKTEDK